MQTSEEGNESGMLGVCSFSRVRFLARDGNSRTNKYFYKKNSLYF